MWEIVTILFTDRWKVMGDVRNSDDTHSLLRDKTYCERWEIVTILFTDRWKVTTDVRNGNNTLYWQMKSNDRCEKW